MWKRIVSAYREFIRDKAGQRFLDNYERWRNAARHPLAGVLIVGAGVILMLGGLALGFIPGVPGIVLAALGAALIATRSRRVAMWLDAMEVRIRAIWRRTRRQIAACLVKY